MSPHTFFPLPKSHPPCYDTYIFLYFSFYLTSCITTAVTWLTPSVLFTVSIYIWLVMTHYQYAVVTQYWYSLFLDSLWLSTIQWLTMSCILIVTVTHCPSDAYCSCDSIVLIYYKYRRLWSLRPQTWLLVSYGTVISGIAISLHSLFTQSYSS